jgi:hypothetical protein
LQEITVTHPNAHLTDPSFWEDVEAAEYKEIISVIEAIPVAERTKADVKKLNVANNKLLQARQEAERLAAKNKKWQDGIEGKTRIPEDAVEVSEQEAKLIFPESTGMPVKEPGKFYCSFCSKEVSSINLTRGTGEPKTQVVMEISGTGEDVVVEEKVKIQARKVMACVDCSHLVKKPIVTSRI